VHLRPPPKLETLLRRTSLDVQPVAIVLAGHNGSGKSTLWYERLADSVQMPLVNADRLTLSLLPEPGADRKLRPWASRLRDEDGRWQKLAQGGVRLFMGLAMEEGIPFAFETVFSHLERQPDGSFQSKVDLIRNLQKHGYYVVWLFVGLASAELSILRVFTRRQKGGHDVPENKLRSRFPRTQQAIQMASGVADLTLMFDNSRDEKHAFSLVRAQRRNEVLYDCRDAGFQQDPDLVNIAGIWLRNVAPR
jgi:predicted ABC-type ATPase